MQLIMRVRLPHNPCKWMISNTLCVTNGGKSSLTTRLNHLLKGSIVINQDDYFLDQDSDRHVIIPELNHPNYEIISSIDHEKLLAKMVEVMQREPPEKPGILIVEGHVIYNMPFIEKMFHRKYFFMLTKEECWKRRRVRVYDPPDPPGYFEKCVWPVFLNHKEEMEKTQGDIVYIDGTQDEEKIFQFVLNDLRQTLSINTKF